MHPIYYNLGLDLPLMIIPDTQAHLDGHAIITHTYHIYKHIPDPGFIRSHENILGVNRNNDPDYMGYITFDVPGKAFSYTADGNIDLETGQVQEIIEHLNHYRDNPRLWPS